MIPRKRCECVEPQPRQQADRLYYCAGCSFACASPQFVEDSIKWRGSVLRGRYAHWCAEWDDLPIDETCPEWPCGCGIVEQIDGVANT